MEDACHIWDGVRGVVRRAGRRRARGGRHGGRFRERACARMGGAKLHWGRREGPGPATAGARAHTQRKW
eukprot:5176466-Prymnesium_polylepis.1